MRESKFELVGRNKATGEIWRDVYTLEQLRRNREVLTFFDLDNDNCELLASRRYTGLKDKNGVDVYEDDVIWYGLNITGDKYMGSVVFDEAGFNLKSPLSRELLPLYGADQLEVIGNIHQNPELLEAK